MFEPVSETTPLELGATYRASLQLKLPDTLEWRKRVVDSLRKADSLVHKLPTWAQLGYDKVSIKNIETGFKATYDPKQKHTSWPVRITFTVKPNAFTGENPPMMLAGNTENFGPLLIAPEILGMLALLLGLVIFGIVVLSHSLEKLVPTKQIPALAILAIAGIFLLSKRR